MPDLIDTAHLANRRMQDARGDKRKAAKSMGLTVPRMNRYLTLLTFPLEAIKAYRDGRISETLMWKLTVQPRDKLAQLWAVLSREGRLKHDDLKTLKGEPTVVIKQLQSAVRKLRAAGLDDERILDLMNEA